LIYIIKEVKFSIFPFIVHKTIIYIFLLETPESQANDETKIPSFIPKIFIKENNDSNNFSEE